MPVVPAIAHHTIIFACISKSKCSSLEAQIKWPKETWVLFPLSFQTTCMFLLDRMVKWLFWSFGLHWCSGPWPVEPARSSFNYPGLFKF